MYESIKSVIIGCGAIGKTSKAQSGRYIVNYGDASSLVFEFH